MDAIIREKQINNMTGRAKPKLIRKGNPDLKDLYADVSSERFRTSRNDKRGHYFPQEYLKSLKFYPDAPHPIYFLSIVMHG